MWAVYVPTTYRAPRPGARNSARYPLCPVYIRLAYRHFTFERGFELALEVIHFIDITSSWKCIHIYIVCKMVWRNYSDSFLWINVPTVLTQVLKVLKSKNKPKYVKITTCYFKKNLIFFFFFHYFRQCNKYYCNLKTYS